MATPRVVLMEPKVLAHGGWTGLRTVKTDDMLKVVQGKKRSLDIQQMATLMVVPKTTLAHSGQILV